MNPRSRFRLPAITVLGMGIIIGAVLTVLTVGGYKASGNPRFCASCHSMEHVQNRWQQSNHKQFGCIECHLPDANIAAQASYKVQAGLNDLFHETLRDYPAAIRISAKGRDILRGNCLRCHQTTIENTAMVKGEADCLKCHRFLVHGRGMERGGMRVE
ncbi:MAG: NapC/NirT family cytochrome c [Pseudomonadota bacterium]|nr:NapC/NirT family cytochrome c [Pseudomonadota bacterium]